MTQLTINFAPLRARRRDPATSHHAASRAHEFAASHQSRIYQSLKTHGPMGAEQIADRLGMDAYQARKRLSELATAGLCEPNGQTRKTVSGRFERVWRAA